MELTNCENENGDILIPLDPKLEDIDEKLTMKRGDILNQMIMIEYRIGVIISKYLCKNDRDNLFREYILEKGNLTFRQLADILINLINHDKEYFTFEERYDLDIFSEKLINIVKKRNIMAHGTIAYDVKNKKFTLKRYKDGIDMDIEKYFYEYNNELFYINFPILYWMKRCK